MKKQWLLSILLNLSVLIQGMESDGKFLSVCVGGYTVKADVRDVTDLYLSHTINYQGDEWVCSVVVGGDSAFSEIVKSNFFTHFTRELKNKKSIEGCLEKAYSECKLLVDKISLKEPLELLASCFDVDSQKMNVLSVGATNSVFGGKDSFAMRVNRPFMGDVFSYHTYDDNFGYCVGASDNFWKAVKCKEVHSLLLAAKKMSTAKFYKKYAPNVNYEVEVDVPHIGGNEDQVATDIAKKLVDAALSKGGNGNIAVMVTLLGSTDWHFSSSSSSDSADCSNDLVFSPKLVPSEPNKEDTEIKPPTAKESWKAFIENHTYKIGGCMVAMLAIIVAAYKYNYLHLNYMVV